MEVERVVQLERHRWSSAKIVETQFPWCPCDGPPPQNRKIDQRVIRNRYIYIISNSQNPLSIMIEEMEDDLSMTDPQRIVIYTSRDSGYDVYNMNENINERVSTNLHPIMIPSLGDVAMMHWIIDSHSGNDLIPSIEFVKILQRHLLKTKNWTVTSNFDAIIITVNRQEPTTLELYDTLMVAGDVKVRLKHDTKSPLQKIPPNHLKYRQFLSLLITEVAIQKANRKNIGLDFK